MKSIVKIWGKIEESLTGALLFSATILLFVNVIMRYFFKSSTTWAEEVIRYMMIWITFIGGSLCTRDYLHVGITLLAENSTPKVAKILTALAEIVSGIFSFIIAYYSLENTLLVLKTSQLSSALRMPMWIVYISLPIGCTFMGIRFIHNVWKTIKDKNIKDDTPDFRML